MNRPLVSVIIPIYNGEKFLKECIDSITGQSFSNLEIVCIDDGSTDSSIEILNKYAKKDNRLVVFSQENAGVSAARNKGIELTRGEFILFVDADDYLIGSDAIKNIVNKKDSADLVMFDLKFEHRQYTASMKTGLYRKNSLHSLYATTIITESLNSPCTKLYRASVIKDNKILFNDSLKIGEDLLFNIEYAQYITSVFYLADAQYMYRTSNENSATSKPMAQKYEQLMSVNHKIERTLLATFNPIPDKIQSALDYIRMKNVISCILDLDQEVITKRELSNRAQTYRKDNGIKPIVNLGLKAYLMSIGYLSLPTEILIQVSKKAKNKKVA